MSDENVPFLSPFNVSWLESSSSFSGLSVNQSRRQILTTKLNVNKYMLYFYNTTFLCVFTRGKCIICLFPYITLSLVHYFMHGSRVFRKQTHLFSYNTHSCFHKQEASCMFCTVYNCFPCTVFFEQDHCSFLIMTRNISDYENSLRYIGLDMLAVELPSLLHYRI